MTNFSYNRDIPDGPHNPSTDQPLMKTNTNSTDDLINVDHVSFGQTDGGYHRSIHLINQAINPSPSANAIQVFSKTATSPASRQLFFEDTSGNVAQLTGALASANGYVWLSGMLIQWGNVPIGTATATFPIPFPNSCLNVQLTAGISGATSTGLSLYVNSITAANFKIFVTGTVTGYGPYYWTAIGY